MAATFAEYLAELDDDALAALLALRHDVCVEPAPRDFTRLADRLSAWPSLVAALLQADRDVLEAGRAIAALGADASRSSVADLIGARPDHVDRAVDRLVELGLGFPDGERLRLPDRLVVQFSTDLGGGESLARVATTSRVDELRLFAEGNGVATAGLRKQELVDAAVAAVADPRVVAARVRALDPEPRRRLGEIMSAFGAYQRRVDAPEKTLIRHGMLLVTPYGVVVPREIATGMWVAVARMTGPPALPPAEADARAVAGSAQEFLRHVGAVLDQARSAPIAMLKTGGIGKRERTRLVKNLDLPDDEQLVLVIDLAFAAGLLAPGPSGYTTTDRFSGWRAASSAVRWSTLVTTWLSLPHTPGFRIDPDSSETAPPLPPSHDSSTARHALLRAVAGGGSLSAAVDRIDWFAPLFGVGAWREGVTVAAADEMVRLGLGDGDGLGPLGRAVFLPPEELAGVAAAHLTDVECQVVLQSDLTAVVSGVPDDDGLRLLTDAADVEARGAATVYRFSSRSVRHALDQGWTAESLLAGLHALAPDVPQPLDYLVHDAARVHGSVRVHEVRTCVVAEEPLATELAAARALRKLGWRLIAPTVLGSGQSPATVLTMLRDAGYSPVLDDGSGAVSVERAAVEPVDAFEPITTPGLQPAEVVRRLREGPSDAEHPTSHTLAQLSRRLTPDELDLLAHSLDRHEPVHITYRVNSGSVTERAITPERLYGPWITAWCHLRNDRRDFTVSSILAVTPA